jgi:ABC-type molybdenum transport system ATPase subunit/photorepair protein PhrA
MSFKRSRCNGEPWRADATGQPMGESLFVTRQPGPLTLSEDDRRVLGVWAADCAERTLSLFEAQAPSDTRPRDAIDAGRSTRPQLLRRHHDPPCPDPTNDPVRTAMTTTTSPPALKVTGLRKSFGGKTVLDGIDLDIAEGTTFSLLGPNGAHNPAR